MKSNDFILGAARESGDVGQIGTPLSAVAHGNLDRRTRNRGIGLELVRQYARAGYEVIATCRTPDAAAELHALAAAADHAVAVHRLDVSSELDLDELAPILGEVAALRDDEHDGIADEADLAVASSVNSGTGPVLPISSDSASGPGTVISSISAPMSTATTPGSARAAETSTERTRA